MVEFKIPWPATINHYYVRSRVGGVMLTKSARQYRRDVAIMLRQYAGTYGASDRLHVTLKLNPATNRKMDIDNRIKAVLDALEYAKIYPDDEQIDKLTVIRGDVIVRGSVDVWIDTCSSNA